VFVICDDEVIEEASAIIAEIAETFGAVIPVRASSSVIDHGDMQFKTGWGLFTLGHTLSDAAYFRVFAAKALIEAGVTGRALYLDSDICVGPGVASLLEFDLEGHPIGARPEIALGSILNAAVKLNLDPATYFNSGVLLFDLEHPDLPSLLERTIDISLHEHERLTFVDQCALNLAFEGRAVMLPPEFNRYLRQHEHVTAEMEEPVVWHFLARPKPWDPMYRSINAMRWISELKVLGQFLSPDRLRRLVAIQFTDARRVEGDFEDKAGLSQVSPG
jgi:lipopolysaccharide biosynthesis glycosyltransferase